MAARSRARVNLHDKDLHTARRHERTFAYTLSLPKDHAVLKTPLFAGEARSRGWLGSLFQSVCRVLRFWRFDWPNRLPGTRRNSSCRLLSTALLLISQEYFPLGWLLRKRERQFLRKDELIDADHSYIPDLSRKGQREGQERAICVNGHCLYPLKNNPPIYTISREANVKKHNRLATLEQTSVSRIRL